MRATVLPFAVASLIAGVPSSSLRAAPSVIAASQDSTSQATPGPRTSTDTIRFGGRVIDAGQTVAGPILVAAGDLRVRGTITGTAVAVAGDIIVESGGSITGDAIAILGAVRSAGGTIGGTSQTFAGTFRWMSNGAESVAPSRRATGDALSLSVGWLVVMLLIAIGVLVFAGSYLDGVTDVLEQGAWRSFLVGVAAELGMVPLLVLLVAGLAITLVGILLIPFAIVAYILAVAGLVTIGFLAVARLVGSSVGRDGARDARGRALRGLVFGVVIFMGAWVVAAAFQWSPALSGALRFLAFVMTYVAATAGLGAAVLSRGGTHRDAATAKTVTDETPAWQTPTPVAGVAAARRPVKV